MFLRKPLVFTASWGAFDFLYYHSGNWREGSGFGSTLPVLPEDDQSWVSALTWQLIFVCNCSPKRSGGALFWPPHALGAQTCLQAKHPYISNNKGNSFRSFCKGNSFRSFCIGLYRLKIMLEHCLDGNTEEMVGSSLFYL